MTRYHCRSCDHTFESEEARCPRCLRASTVEPDEAREPAVPPALRHVRTNAILQTALLALHVLIAVTIPVQLVLSALAAAHHGAHLGPVLSFFEPPAGGDGRLAYFATLVCIGLWAAVGLPWTGLNAWGLSRRRPWALRSTRAYWACSLVTCACIPFGLYGLVSLARPGVRALFEPPPPTA